MTEELLNVLARVPQLKVAARTSVFEFKGKGGDVREIGHKLGVSHIVEGSVRREGEQVRVTAQLVRVADGFHVWSESYDRELKGVFALQDDIARHIVEQLETKLGVAESAGPARGDRSAGVRRVPQGTDPLSPAQGPAAGDRASASRGDACAGVRGGLGLAVARARGRTLVHDAGAARDAR